MGRSQPNIVIDVQAPVTHAAIVMTMEREMGHPPHLVRTPDVCDRFQASEDARRPGLDETMDAPRNMEASFEEIER